MRSAWLTDWRGAPYVFRLAKQAGAVGFQLLHQDGEGRLWRRVCDSTGAPVFLAFDVTRAAVLEAVGAQHGAVQLVPVDARSRGVGTPPEMVVIDPLP